MALQWSITVTSAVTLNDVGHIAVVTEAMAGAPSRRSSRSSRWRSTTEETEILRPAKKSAGSQDDKSLGVGVELRAKSQRPRAKSQELRALTPAVILQVPPADGRFIRFPICRKL